jgi:predicted ThiF/HesA family dinucleotide-utilizing enzyme
VWFARTSEGFRAWFALKASNGLIRTGAIPANFTVTIVNPGDTASTTAAVAQSAQKPGLYTFTIPSAFLVTHGVGDYGVVVQVNVPAPQPVVDVIANALTVSLQDFDSLDVALAAVATDVTRIRKIVTPTQSLL